MAFTGLETKEMRNTLALVVDLSKFISVVTQPLLVYPLSCFFRIAVLCLRDSAPWRDREFEIVGKRLVGCGQNGFQGTSSFFMFPNTEAAVDSRVSAVESGIEIHEKMSFCL